MAAMAGRRQVPFGGDFIFNQKDGTPATKRTEHWRQKHSLDRPWTVPGPLLPMRGKDDTLCSLSLANPRKNHWSNISWIFMGSPLDQWERQLLDRIAPAVKDLHYKKNSWFNPKVSLGICKTQKTKHALGLAKVGFRVKFRIGLGMVYCCLACTGDAENLGRQATKATKSHDNSQNAKKRRRKKHASPENKTKKHPQRNFGKRGPPNREQKELGSFRMQSTSMSRVLAEKNTQQNLGLWLLHTSTSPEALSNANQSRNLPSLTCQWRGKRVEELD